MQDYKGSPPPDTEHQRRNPTLHHSVQDHVFRRNPVPRTKLKYPTEVLLYFAEIQFRTILRKSLYFSRLFQNKIGWPAFEPSGFVLPTLSRSRFTPSAEKSRRELKRMYPPPTGATTNFQSSKVVIILLRHSSPPGCLKSLGES